MFMRRFSFCLVVTVLVHLDGPVSAEWLALESRYQSYPLQTAYIDPGTIHRDGNLVALSALIDWKAMQGGRTPTRFYSTKLSKQLDCQKKLIRTLASTDFYGHMGMGEVIGSSSYASEDQWIVIRPGTLNEGLWEAGCRNE